MIDALRDQLQNPSTAAEEQLEMKIYSGEIRTCPPIGFEVVSYRPQAEGLTPGSYRSANHSMFIVYDQAVTKK